MNYYKIKCKVLEWFYLFIDQGITNNKVDYDIAVEKTLDYDEIHLNFIEKMIWFFAITSRYARNGRIVYDSFEAKVRTALSNFKSLNLSELEMSEEDKKQFKADAKEVEEYLAWLDKNKLN